MCMTYVGTWRPEGNIVELVSPFALPWIASLVWQGLCPLNLISGPRESI